MTQIEFNDENQINRNVRPHQTSSGFSKKLISWGLAKNEQQANIYLFILVVIMFGLIIYMNINTFSAPAIDVVEDPTLVP